MLGQCYDTALYEVESPVITGVLALGSYFVVLRRCILGGKSGFFHRGTGVVSVSVVHERNKVTLLCLSEHQREYQQVPA